METRGGDNRERLPRLELLLAGRGRRSSPCRPSSPVNARGRWRERVGEGGGRGGALADLGPDAAAATHIAVVEERASERERDGFHLGERAG